MCKKLMADRRRGMESDPVMDFFVSAAGPSFFFARFPADIFFFERLGPLEKKDARQTFCL